MTISLAFLAPDLVKAAIEGRLARGIGFSAIPQPNGRVSTGCSVFQLLKASLSLIQRVDGAPLQQEAGLSPALLAKVVAFVHPTCLNIEAAFAASAAVLLLGLPGKIFDGTRHPIFVHASSPFAHVQSC